MPPDVVAVERLAVGGAHHDRPLIGQDHILMHRAELDRAVVHGRPEVVALEAKNQLVHLFIGFGANVAELGIKRLGGPRLKTPILVIDENASVLHVRRTLLERAGLDVKRFLRIRSDVRPPVPWRNADLLRQFKHPKRRAAPIASGDDQRLLDAREGIIDDLYDVRLPLAAHAFNIDLAVIGELIDQLALPERTDQNDTA